jgi:hypothetical protein
MRYPILDGLRGFFLIFMTVTHLNEYLRTTVGKLNHHQLGYVEDAQGFIFLSGLVVGLVYGGKLVRNSPAVMRRALLARWLTIYKYHAGLILIFLAVALTIGSHGDDLLQPYVQQPIAFTLASLALLTCSHEMGILPLYLYFIAATPFMLMLFHRGLVVPAAAISIIAWMLGQLMLASAASDAASAAVASWGYEIPFRLGFNLLGWQIIYMMGLYAGYRLATKPIDLSFLREPQYEVAFHICLGALLILLIMRQITLNDWLSPAFTDAFVAAMPRRNFSAMYLVAFLIDLFMLAWLFEGAPHSQSMTVQRVGQFVRWLFTRRFLTLLGQHSLQVFSWHLIVLYIVLMITDKHWVGEIKGSILIGGAVLSLYIPAYLHAAYGKRRKGKARSLPTQERQVQGVR